MRLLRRSLAVPIVVATAALLVTACGGSSNTGSKKNTTTAVNIAASGKPCSYRFAFITHGDNGNFWSVASRVSQFIGRRRPRLAGLR
jgi:hypothetical protein